MKETVKLNLGQFRNSTRTYPVVEVGDRVRLYKKNHKPLRKKPQNGQQIHMKFWILLIMEYKNCIKLPVGRILLLEQKY